jgi:antitoxin component HigA of HigAB toxin-antitoxin module
MSEQSEQLVRVQLAYEHEGHDPDDVIEVPESEARRMITEGRARVPDDEHHEVAASSGVRLSGTALDGEGVTVDDLQEEIRARQAEGADLKVTGNRDELIKRLHDDDEARA